ncbi:hypothetical protein SHI21_16490 [Bacteriovorax sp. PP10]|uniref:Uncharacterized protein n=1 Tax=Bacteriovorax antarcticus TaxID=3088717 RepID=A0ABU5VXQ9_9BACT|nr:hypothetical protein [Bacteriovorax sp. PP10]MEA9357831.1 hypothetical protein [Bacteriovorax sp. PP10]
MKTLLILAIGLLPCVGFAEIPKCSAQKVNIIGKYGEKGEVSSPILDTWSEVSGNLTAFEIRAKEAFTKALLVLKSADNIVLFKLEIPIKKNRGSDFDLIAEIKKQKIQVKSLDLQLYSGNTAHEFCHEETVVTEVDGTGAREVKNDKAVK